MRIIAGIHRGRKIHGPPTSGRDALVTRPITDRVKESLFNRLMAKGATGGGRAADIFSGTGSMGLEAISRGAEHCTFIEQNRTALELLERNLSDLRLTDQATVLAGDALSPLWASRLPAGELLTLIFCDPPYAMTADAEGMSRIAKLIERLADVADPDAIAVLRTQRSVEAPPIAGWRGPASHAYGSMVVHLYERG